MKGERGRLRTDASRMQRVKEGEKSQPEKKVNDEEEAKI